MVVVVYRGQGRVCELMGFGGGDGVCVVEWVWRCCGQILKKYRKKTHPKAYALTPMCGMIIVTLNIHVCIYIYIYIYIYISTYIHIHMHIYICVRICTYVYIYA